MSSFLSSVSPSSSNSGTVECPATDTEDLIPSITTDVTARKEAIMTQVRTELALANAQELINVCDVSSPNLLFASLRLRIFYLTDRKRTSNVTPNASRSQAILFPAQNRYSSSLAVDRPSNCVIRRVFPGAWIVTWKLVSL